MKNLLLQKIKERRKLIEEIEKKRGSRLISYLTVPRQSFGAGISSVDTIPLFYEHLNSIGKVEQVDLFLYTGGGHALSPVRIIHLFREFCKKLCVLIPFRAQSAGTILALGADEIVMGRLGELGPVDPSVSNFFNPEEVKDNKKERVPISVEDVSAYFDLIRERGSADPSVLSTAIKALTDRIHPLALGNVQRQYLLIRSLSKRLLGLHMKGGEEKKIDQIVDFLSEKLYNHTYEISRHEAKEVIGLNIVYPSEEVEKPMWKLYTNYSEGLLLGREFDFGGLLKEKAEGDFSLVSAIIESAGLSHPFSYSVNVKRKDGGNEFDIRVNSEGWEEIRSKEEQK